MTLEALRIAKDEFFRGGDDSPLDHDQRHGFGGLRYYADDPVFRLTVELDAAEAGSSELIETSQGSAEPMVRAGRFHFTVDGRSVQLAAFRSHDDGTLFIPFRDATGKTESYPAGRYVEAVPAADGRWLLDFNRSYNPYCAYNDEWRCPLPPVENWLDVEIRAGEKRFH